MKKKLSQYNSIKKEIKNLENRIKRTEEQKDKIERDSVKGSNPFFPYEARTFQIEGIGTDKEDRIWKLNKILTNRKNKCEDIKIEIEEFINKIDDSVTRRIFQYRYIDELEWLAISRRIGGYEESYARKKHDRYLEGIDE